MSTSGRKTPRPQRGFVPTTALATAVTFDDDMMHVQLTDCRVVSVPIIWFPVLHQAKPKQRRKVKIGGGGVALHWPELDEDLSIAGLMAGVDRQSA